MSKPNGYQISEKDIDGMLAFLKATDPDNATPEMAIEILEHLHASVHTMSHEQPEELMRIYENLKTKAKNTDAASKV